MRIKKTLCLFLVFRMQEKTYELNWLRDDYILVYLLFYILALRWFIFIRNIGDIGIIEYLRIIYGTHVFFHVNHNSLQVYYKYDCC